MEWELLEGHGHRVLRYQDSNTRIHNGFMAGFSSIWNQGSYRRLRQLASAEKPAVAHFHNTFPLISPAAYYAVGRQGIPIVQKLSNFRLLCPGGLLLRDGAPCEDCIKQDSLVPAIRHACYRNSHAGTAAVASMILAHRAAGTWRERVDVYIALSKFARAKFIEGGLPADRIVVKPNFLHPDPGPGDGAGGYALFVGRLSEEKGIETLAAAWRMLPELPLRVAGDGSLKSIEWPANVTPLGHQSREQVIELMKGARLLIFPSICYENAPVTILEAFACGLPVIASDRGSIPEMIDPHRTGLLFRPGDPADLARHVRWAIENPTAIKEMRESARKEFVEKYTAERNYSKLIEVYDLATERASET